MRTGSEGYVLPVVAVMAQLRLVPLVGHLELHKSNLVELILHLAAVNQAVQLLAS